MNTNSGLLDSPTSEYWPKALLGGVALGGAFRAGKALYDMLLRKPEASSIIEADEKYEQPGVVEIPVEVSPEEEAELNKRGIKVGSSIVDTLGNSALLTGAGLGGWWLVNRIVNDFRKREAASQLELSKRRVKNLLEGNPDPEDIKVAEVMQQKFAESSIGNVWNSASKLVSDTASTISEKAVNALVPRTAVAALGVFGVLSALAAYNRTRQSNTLVQKGKAIKDLLKSRPTLTSQVVLRPVRRKPVQTQPTESLE